MQDRRRQLAPPEDGWGPPLAPATTARSSSLRLQATPSDLPGPGLWAPLERQRYPSDLLRVALGALIVVAMAAVANEALPSSLQVNAFHLVNELPPFVGPPLLGVMQLGALGAVGVLALVALLGRRVRLAPLILGAGSISWAAARLLQGLIDEDQPVLRVPQVVLHAARAPGFAFPATHVAVAAAMATVARGELSRPARRLAWLAVGLVAVARLYVGAHLPADVIGGLGLGWALGALVNIVVGVRPAAPDATQLAGLLTMAGRPATAVRAVSVSPDAAARFILETPEGLRMMKAVARDDPESDWLRRAWRLVAFRQLTRYRTPATASHRVDHEAYVSLLAERAGVSVAPLLATWSAGGTELIERAWVEGRSLAERDRLDHRLLATVWAQLERLEAAGIAHRVLPSSHIVVDGEGVPWIIELGDARVGVGGEQIVGSRATALADLASVVGARAAVDALVASQGPDVLPETLAKLQLVELPPDLRHRLDRCPDRFEGLRTEVGRACGVATSPSSRPVRAAARNLVPVAAAGAALFVLLTHVGQAGTAVAALTAASPAWVTAAALAAALTYVLAGTVVVAASPVLISFWRTVSAQVAAAAANRASPAGLGGMALNVRYLEMSGATRPQAGGVVAVSSATGLVVHAVGSAVLVVVIGRRSPLSLGADLDPSWPVLGGVIVASSVAGAGVWYWRLHRRLAALARLAASGVAVIARSPVRLGILIGSSAGVSVAYAAALGASVRAAGGHITLASALVVYLVASAVGALSPAPGGLGTLEAALIAGLSQQGLSTAPAVAGVLTYRIITYWLPVLPGLFFLGVLRRRHAL